MGKNNPTIHRAHRIKTREADPEAYYASEALRIARWREAHPIAFRARRLLSSAQQRASKRAIPFGLTPSWAEPRLAANKCELTGLPFDFTPGSPYAPSIDQIIPKAGYTPENSRMIIVAANLAKGRWDDAALYEWAEALLANRLHVSADTETGQCQ